MPVKTSKKKTASTKATRARRTPKKGGAATKSKSTPRAKGGKGASTAKKKKKKAVKTAKTTKKAKPARAAKTKSSRVTKKAKPDRSRPAGKAASDGSKVSRKKKPESLSGTRTKAAARAAKVPKLSAEQKKAIRAERAARRKMLTRFREFLMRKRQDVLQAYHSTKGATLDRSTDGTEDYIDYAVSSYDRDFMLSLTELERRQLHLVEEALARIGSGEFGRCLECGQEIPLKRLEVEAWARFCIRCQELDDQGLLDEHPSAADADDDEGNEAASTESPAPSDADDDAETDPKILEIDENEPDEELV